MGLAQVGLLFDIIFFYRLADSPLLLTAAGDPLEFGAIGAVFDRSNKTPPLYVGTVKPNIGHLEGAAGLAGIIKTVLSLEAGIILPNINFQIPNPKLRLAELNFIVPTVPIPWPTQGLRRASINSFGYGGTNGHCILDDANHYLSARGLPGRTHTNNTPFQLSPLSDSTDSGLGPSDTSEDGDYFSQEASSRHHRLFILSAPEQNALGRLGESHAAFLQDLMQSKSSGADALLDGMAFTLGTRRSAFQWRTAVTGTTATDLANRLLEVPKPLRASKPPKLLFCFNGQGSQWHAMGRELLSHEVYRRSVAAADEYFPSLGASWSVLKELSAPEDTTNVNKPQFSQPLCTVIQIALVDLLRHWNIFPSIVVGHSSGEIAASYAFGALSREDCWKISFHRGRLASEISVIAPHVNGSMMAIGLGENEIRPYMAKLILSEADILTVACVNSPSSITVSGDTTILGQVESLLREDKIFCRRLAVENAYHSAHMRHIESAYLESLQNIRPLSPATGITMISSVTGESIAAEKLGPAYWVDNLVSPVRFLNAVESAFKKTKGERRQRGARAIDTVVEIGPHGALQSAMKQILTKLSKVQDTTYLTVLRRGHSATNTALEMAGVLWCKGAKVDLLRVNSLQETPNWQIPLTELPKYPWNHENRYWHESTQSKGHRFRHAPRNDLLGAPIQEFNWLEPTWKNTIRLSEQPWIADHKIRGNDVLPAASMVCAALEGVRQIADKSKIVARFEFQDIVIGRALLIPPSDPGLEVFTRLTPQRNGIRASTGPWYHWTFVSLEISDSKKRNYVEHASGLVSITYRSESSETTEKIDTRIAARRFLASKEKCTQKVSPEEHYRSTANMGFEYGPCHLMFPRRHFRCFSSLSLTFLNPTTLNVDIL